MHILLRRALRGLHRATGHLVPPAAFAKSYPGVPGRIHIDDLMLRNDSPEAIRHYLSAGTEAIELMELICGKAGRQLGDIRSFLDFPCGYGRVTRHAIARIPPACITAADVDSQAVRFCAAEFRVKPLVTPRDVRDISLPERYDLVFVGSLLTHLPVEDGIALLRILGNCLHAEGVLIFTTQGETCLEHLQWYGTEFVAAEATYRRLLKEQGACFTPYRRYATYGITLHAQRYLERIVSDIFGSRLESIQFSERGWNGHQDLWSFRSRG
jgi:trans-aconitate methyltransferase